MREVIGMRHPQRAMSEADAWDTLRACDYGILSVVDLMGDPYAVPLSFACEGEKIYFHSAKQGYKTVAIGTGGRVAFCAVAEQRTVPEELSVYYRSVIAFGRCDEIFDEQTHAHALRLICDKYAPGSPDVAASLEKYGPHTAVYCIDVDGITGKNKQSKS